MTTQSLASAVTTTGVKPGVAVPPTSSPKAVQVVGSTTSGVGTAVVQIGVTLDGKNYIPLPGTITLTLGTAEVTDGLVVDGAWSGYNINVTSLTGTGASVSALIGF